jgi:hypothetical protein
MKKIKIILIMLIILCTTANVVQAKTVLLSCEYYKEYTELNGSQATAVLCNIYTDYSHQCYVAYGQTTATTSNNKEKITNWSKAKGTSYKIKDYVKENNSCPDYLVLKLNTGINGYEVHAATAKDEAISLSTSLGGQRYVAELKGIEHSESDLATEKQNVLDATDYISKISSNFSLDNCTSKSACESSLNAYKTQMNIFVRRVENYINAGYFTEDDQIIKDYRTAVSEANIFIAKASSEIEKKYSDSSTSTENSSTGSTSSNTNTSEDLTVSKVCTQEGVLRSFKFLGNLLLVARILVPIVLIIMGSIDFGKAVIASNQDAVIKSAKTFATRIVAGVIVFLLPTIVNFAFNLLPAGSNDYSACRTCFFKPSSCSVSSSSTSTSSGSNTSSSTSTSSTTTKKLCSNYNASDCPTKDEKGNSCKVAYDNWDTSHQHGYCTTSN